MAADAPGGSRFIELHLGAKHLVVVLLVIVAAAAALLARQMLGRRAVALSGAARPAAAPGVEDVRTTESVFDREGSGGAARASGRQVTRENPLSGEFELDLGATNARTLAGELAVRASSLGVAAEVVRDRNDGPYRVVAGPFRTADEARSAAARLATVLGRKVQVRARAAR